MKHPEWRPKTEVEALGHLIEEAGEVLQMAGRLVRFCTNPDGTVEGGWADSEGRNNLRNLQDELSDLDVAIKGVRELVFAEAAVDEPKLVYERDYGRDASLPPQHTWCSCEGRGSTFELRNGLEYCPMCRKPIVNNALSGRPL